MLSTGIYACTFGPDLIYSLFLPTTAVLLIVDPDQMGGVAPQVLLPLLGDRVLVEWCNSTNSNVSSSKSTHHSMLQLPATNEMLESRAIADVDELDASVTNALEWLSVVAV